MCDILCNLFQDDALAQVLSLVTQMKDIDLERERTENRLSQLQKALCEVEEGKRYHFTVFRVTMVTCL